MCQLHHSISLIGRRTNFRLSFIHMNIDNVDLQRYCPLDQVYCICEPGYTARKSFDSEATVFHWWVCNSRSLKFLEQ